MLKKDIDQIYSNDGCDECTNGYLGRIAIHEVLLINQEIRDAISSNVRKDALRSLVYKSGVTTLLQDGLEKVLAGQTTLEEILKIVELEDDEKEEAFATMDEIDDNNISSQPANTNISVNNNNFNRSSSDLINDSNQQLDYLENYINNGLQ